MWPPVFSPAFSGIYGIVALRAGIFPHTPFCPRALNNPSSVAYGDTSPKGEYYKKPTASRRFFVYL